MASKVSFNQESSVNFSGCSFMKLNVVVSISPDAVWHRLQLQFHVCWQFCDIAWPLSKIASQSVKLDLVKTWQRCLFVTPYLIQHINRTLIIWEDILRCKNPSQSLHSFEAVWKALKIMNTLFRNWQDFAWTVERGELVNRFYYVH